MSTTIQTTSQTPTRAAATGLATVIVGSGLAGWTVARELRALLPQSRITVISADAGDFYSKPMLSNAFALKKTVDGLVAMAGAAQAAKVGLDLMAYTDVHAIDTAAQTLHTSGGNVHYDQLVLAIGADPIRLSMPGDEHVLSVNNWHDYAAFRAALDGCADAANPSRRARVLIMGAGLIGSEFANDLSTGGHEVHVVDPGERPLAALLAPEQSAGLQQALVDLGVRFHLGTTATGVSVSGDGAKHVTLSNAEVVPADVVLSAVGLRPRTALAAASGLEVGRGIHVDAMGQTSAPNVYAVGDCAAYASAAKPELFDGAPRGLPFVLPIMTAAKAIAKTLAGEPTPIVFAPMAVRVKTPAFPLSVQA
jgi:rubredoxin---NAD+ reductase